MLLRNLQGQKGGDKILQVISRAIFLLPQEVDGECGGWRVVHWRRHSRLLARVHFFRRELGRSFELNSREGTTLGLIGL